MQPVHLLLPSVRVQALDRNKSMYLITRFALPGSPTTPVRETGVSFTSSIGMSLPWCHNFACQRVR